MDVSYHHSIEFLPPDDMRQDPILDNSRMKEA